MNLAQALGLFFSFYASKEGRGAKVPFPGPPVVYNARYTDIGQDRLARFHIFVSVHPEREKVSQRAFNIGDEDNGTTWAEKWAALASHFGLEGTGPDEGVLTGVQYVMAHRGEWESWSKKMGIRTDEMERTDWEFMSVWLELAAFDRWYDLGRARGIGWSEKAQSKDEYFKAWERMSVARIIP